MPCSLLAGAAKTNITPPVGTTMGGYAGRKEGARGVHDPLWAKALVLRSNGAAVAVVACDVLGLTADVVAPARAAIAERFGIPVEHTMVACSHTHSGPDTLRLFREAPHASYFALVQANIVGAVEMAQSRLRPARAGWGRGCVEGVSINRRTFEQGPLDTEVGVLRVEDDSGQPIALLVNFACHPVTLGGNNLLLSADFPGYAMALLEQADPGCTALFLNGAFGNVNTGHRADIDVGDRGERTFARARKLGHMLAGEALKTHNNIACSPEVALAGRRRLLELPTRELPEIDADELRAQAEGSGDLYARELLMLSESHPATLDTEAMALRIGDGVLAGAPAEYFIEYQIALKQNSPCAHTYLAAPVNDWVGYVPTRAACDDGGYETRLCRWSKLAPDCGDTMYEALLDLTTALGGRP